VDPPSTGDLRRWGAPLITGWKDCRSGARRFGSRCTIPDLVEAFKQVGTVVGEQCFVGNWCFEQFVEKDEDTISMEAYYIDTANSEVLNATFAELFIEKDDKSQYFLTVQQQCVYLKFASQVEQCWASVLPAIPKANKHKRKTLATAPLPAKKQKTCFVGKVFYITNLCNKNLTSAVTQNGGTITNFMKNANYYVLPDKIGRAKTSTPEAQKYNVPIVSENFVWRSSEQGSLQQYKDYLVRF